MRRLIAATLTLASAAAPAAADVLHLRDGTAVEGRLHRIDPFEWVVYAPDRRATFVAVADVASIEVTARPPTDPVAAAGRLAAVREFAAAADPAAAVDRYRAFIAAGADPATLATAKQEQAVWQDRADRGLVRLGDRCVLPAARDQAVGDSLAAADAARRLLKRGQFAPARPLVAAALIMDPQDVSALYLQGLLQLQQNQPTAARASFAAVAAAVPTHAPTRVNLAVIDWQQGHAAAALAGYEQAMTLSPADPAVLADVAAALAAVDALPAAVRRNPVVGRVAALFQQQDAALTARGLHRFGTAWLTDAQLADVRRGQAQDAAQLDRLTADFDRLQDHIRRTDLDIAEVEQRARGSIAPAPWLASYDGGPGPVYLDLSNDADQLRRRRSADVARLDALQQQAVALRRRMAGQPAGGPAQHVIGPEATPVRVGG